MDKNNLLKALNIIIKLVELGCTLEDLDTIEFCEDCNQKVLTTEYSETLRACRTCQQFTKPF